MSQDISFDASINVSDEGADNSVHIDCYGSFEEFNPYMVSTIDKAMAVHENPAVRNAWEVVYRHIKEHDRLISRMQDAADQEYQEDMRTAETGYDRYER